MVRFQTTQRQSATPEETNQPSELEAPAFERAHVHTVYSEIAPHFSATRHTAWPQVVEFLSQLPPHSIVADVGCGNGKYLLALLLQKKSIHIIGMDSCIELCDLTASATAAAQEKITRSNVVADVLGADALALPFRNGLFDAAISIAVTHHLSTRRRRIAAHEALARLLRPGGRALIYVWAQERPESESVTNSRGRSKMMARRFDAQDLLIPWHMRTRKDGAADDRILGDWHQVHRRFYHVYANGELEQELDQVDGLSLIRTYYDHQNWCAVVEKA